MSELVDSRGRPIGTPRPVIPAALSSSEAQSNSPQDRAPESRDGERHYRLASGIEVTRDYFLEDRNRTAYPGIGGLLFIERIAGDCFLIQQDGVTVDLAQSKEEAEQFIAEFHQSVENRQRQELEAERERQERHDERRAHCERTLRDRWPGA